MTALVLQVDTKNWLERVEKKNKVYSTKRTIGKSLFVEHRSVVYNIQHSVLTITFLNYFYPTDYKEQISVLTESVPKTSLSRRYQQGLIDHYLQSPILSNTVF